MFDVEGLLWGGRDICWNNIFVDLDLFCFEVFEFYYLYGLIIVFIFFGFRIWNSIEGRPQIRSRMILAMLILIILQLIFPHITQPETKSSHTPPNL